MLGNLPINLKSNNSTSTTQDMNGTEMLLWYLIWERDMIETEIIGPQARIIKLPHPARSVVSLSSSLLLSPVWHAIIQKKIPHF